jgi:hypothetical protein
MFAKYFKVTLFTLFYLVQVKVHAWEVDLTRRQVDFQRIQNVRMPASVVSVDPNINTNSDDKTSLEVVEAIKRAVAPIEGAKDIVIVQTETGFVPDSINLQKGQVYEIHIVNLNHKEKNVSFLMDSFSQSHNTVYGNMKAFKISPNIEGVFSYQSPETGATGKVVVVADKVRKVASDFSDKNK